MTHIYKQTICWECANAVPNIDGTRGCSWSRDFEPVEGWDAEQTEVMRGYLQNSHLACVSYLVKRCPLFKEDE